MTWLLLYVLFLLTLYRVDCPFPTSGKTYNFTWFAVAPSSNAYNRSEFDGKLMQFSERNCAKNSVLGWMLICYATLDLILLEGHPGIVRFRRMWYPMKTFTVRKMLKHFNLFLVLLHVGKFLFLISIYVNTIPSCIGIDVFPVECQYISASFGIFLAGLQSFLQLGKIPQFKGYIKMLTNIISTMCLVGLLYMPLIITFSMVFCILLPGVVTYATPFEAFIRMVTFTIGEINFEDTFYGEDATPPASFIFSAIFLAVAILILHVTLLNFLIGLTITELREIWEFADVWKTYSYVWQIYLCETFLANFPFGLLQGLFPDRLLLTRLDKGMILKDNIVRADLSEVEFIDIPKKLRREIRQLGLGVGCRHLNASSILSAE